jgi:hypothetical protein
MMCQVAALLHVTIDSRKDMATLSITAFRAWLESLCHSRFGCDPFAGREWPPLPVGVDSLAA